MDEKVYIFATFGAEPAVGPIVTTPASTHRQAATLRAHGATVTILDEEERNRYADLTRQLLEVHPELAV